MLYNIAFTATKASILTYNEFLNPYSIQLPTSGCECPLIKLFDLCGETTYSQVSECVKMVPVVDDLFVGDCDLSTYHNHLSGRFRNHTISSFTEIKCKS